MRSSALTLVAVGFCISFLSAPAFGVGWPPVEWTTQTGTSSDDYSDDLALDASGNIYITGGTEGVLGAGAFGGLHLIFGWVIARRYGG